MRRWQRVMVMMLGAAAAIAGSADVAAAQKKKKGGKKIPPGKLPPPGMCRVWYDDRPPGHQPPPTDCSTARHVAYESGGRLVYGGGRPSEDELVVVVVDEERPRPRGDVSIDITIDARGSVQDARTTRELPPPRSTRDDDAWEVRETTETRETREIRETRETRTTREARGARAQPATDDADARPARDDRDDRHDPRGGYGDATSAEPSRCVDTDRDGWCDPAERASTTARPGDRPGDRSGERSGERPAASSRPMMVWAIVFSRGGTVVEVQKWLKSADVRVRVVDDDKDGVPEVATWFDRSGVVLQRWIDDDEDGQADRVGIYENGKVARVIE